MDNERPRLLVLGGKATRDRQIIQALEAFFHVDFCDRMQDAMGRLRSDDPVHAIFADVGDFLPLERELVGEKSQMVLNTIGEGVCVVDTDGRCSWSNHRMRQFPPEVFEKVKQICCQARAVFMQHHSPHTDAAMPRSKKFTLQHQDRYFELMTSPVADEQGEVRQVVAVVWDATSGRKLQRKIDAIDASGREMARLESDAVAKLTPDQRLKLLQDKIIKYSRDLMHFDHFAIRLLDKKTNKLEVVISEGFPPEALDLDLYAQAEGNGISGYVAATGRSYICHDTEKDPRYVPGLSHCMSSLTVPLRLYDKVIGVYNIESVEVGAFNEDDRQFAEIFARYVAMALNILDLLVVERVKVSGQLADNVVQEMAQPLNDIVTEAQSLKEEYIGDDTMRHRLNHIVDQVQVIRKQLSDVAAGPTAVLGCDTDNGGETDPLIAGKRVLIADDEENIRNTIAGILRKRGCEVVVCKDGFEACCTIDQETVAYDLIISDIKMPYRTGYEIFAAARRRWEKIPVVLMTGFGYDPNHSIVRASAEGMASALFKPFKVEQLMAEVYKALGITPQEPPLAPPEPVNDEKRTGN